MRIEITLKCPDCSGENIVKNGKKSYQIQNYLCKDCNRQFIGDHALKYNGCHSELYQKIELMLVRNVGIRDIAEIENVSINTVLSILTKSDKKITPKQKYYDVLEIDENTNWQSYSAPSNTITKEISTTGDISGKVTIRRSVRVKFAIN